jgi:hypothetical protein
MNRYEWLNILDEEPSNFAAEAAVQRECTRLSVKVIHRKALERDDMNWLRRVKTIASVSVYAQCTINAEITRSSLATESNI